MSIISPIHPQNLLGILETVKDPEVPVLSVTDLGIIREIKLVKDAEGTDCWEIIITPTYSGCPAMDMIATGIRMALYAAGISRFQIVTQLSPAWTTEWMTALGKEKLKAYGIAPPRPLPKQLHAALFEDPLPVDCPRCGSVHTSLLSQFGSTACKALYQCDDCKEPFDYFKCH
jgi:ring-1,2-phenylacetyl-CoA epoxidase subunit PaaD